MTQRHEGLFALPCDGGAQMYFWDGALLHKKVFVKNGGSLQLRYSIEHDVVLGFFEGWSSPITVYLGSIRGDAEQPRTISAPVLGPTEWHTRFTSFATDGAVLYATTSVNGRLVALDLESTQASFATLCSPLKVVPNSLGETSTVSGLMMIDARLISLDFVDGAVTWRVIDSPNARNGTVVPKTVAVNGAGFWASAVRGMEASAGTIIVRAHSFGHHSDYVRVMFFNRRSLARIFTVECPMRYTRGIEYPESYYVHVDAWEEQLLVCEYNRGIGILREDAIDALGQKSSDGIVAPERLHAEARWIQNENARIVSAYFCGSGGVATVWRDKTTQALMFAHYDISDLWL